MPASPPVPYQKLPGRGTSALQLVRLYLGPDHLLQVTSNGFTESYKRFFFQDIQAITLHHTLIGKAWNVALVALAALFASLGLAIGGDAIAPLCLVALFWLILMAINVGMGPTCACYIKTAVQTQRLSSLSRVRRAGRLIERIRPHLTAAQGELTVEEIQRRLDPAQSLGYAAPAAFEPPIN